MPDVQFSPSNKDVDEFLENSHGLLINGDWIAGSSGESIDVINPATEQKIAAVSGGNHADIDHAVNAAREAFSCKDWSNMSPSSRAGLIFRLADLLEQHSHQLTLLEILDNGMPLNRAGALAVPLAARMLRYYAGWVDKISGSTLPVDTPPTGSDVFTYTRKEPVGVAGQITPWNYPLGMLAMKLGPALATGCTVVLKPAEQTPLSAIYVGHLIQKAGFPKGVVNIVTGYGDTAGAALVNHNDVDKVAFTGSTEVGRKIIAASASNLKKVSLELGGKSPFIVCKDADLKKAIPAAAFSAFFLQGQNCMCASRLYVHNDIHDEFVSGMKEIAQSMKIGPGLDPETQLGPLVSKEQEERVLTYVESGLSEGADLVCGGRKKEGVGFFVEPTIFTETNQSMKVVSEEIFGPVTCVQKFEYIDEVIELANDTDYGLVGSVWTDNLKIAHTIAAKVRAGTIGVNTHGHAGITAPFGGYRQSGWGREFGKESLDLYLQTKTVSVHY